MTQVADKPAPTTAKKKEDLLSDLKFALTAEFPELGKCGRVELRPLWTPGKDDEDFSAVKKTRVRVNGWTRKDREETITFSRFVVAWMGEKGVQYRVAKDRDSVLP